MKYPKSIPDDYRRNLWNFESLLESGQFWPVADGEPDTFHSYFGAEHTDEMLAQLRSTPRNVLIIQTPHGRFQITVGDAMTITCIDAHASISIRPTSGNTIEIRGF